MLKTTVEKITPEKAREYLRTNTDNYRKLSRTTVKKYAEDMKNGRWELNGEPICFGANGILKDGQHRLAAIILSGKTIETNVTRGVDDSVSIYNVGKKRTNVDIANARGIDCDKSLVAVANIVVNKFGFTRNGTEVVNYVEDHFDELNRAMRVTCYGPVAKKSRNAPSIAASYLMLRTERMPIYEIELFYRLLYDFNNTRADGYSIGPAVVARKMLDERGNLRGGSQMQKERLEILVMAMNDFHDGNSRELRYKIAEPFQFMDMLTKIRKIDGLEG